jgi:tetratricopeptide (TPR) repeat protein
MPAPQSSRPPRSDAFAARTPRLTFLALAVAIALAVGCRRKPASLGAGDTTAASQRPAAGAPATPLPTTLPFIGPDARDADGITTRTVDRAAFRALLAAGRWGDLNRYFTELQDAFEADPHKETWVTDAADSFASAEPEIEPALDAWVAGTPGSFAPWLARATHWLNVAFTRRGARYASETSAEAFAGMREALGHVRPDAAKAVALRPKLVAARRLEIRAANGASDRAAMEAALGAALATCPTCFQVRVVYLWARMAMWGGSRAEITRVAEEAVKMAPDEPRLRWLASFVDLEEADTAYRANRFDAAVDALDRALARGDYWEAWQHRARYEMKRGHRAEALRNAERAVALRPAHPVTLVWRAWAYYEVRRDEDAARDLVGVLRMCPTDEYARELAPLVATRLSGAASDAAGAGRAEEARRLRQLVESLAPGTQGPAAEPAPARPPPPSAAAAPGDDLAIAEAAAKASPDDVDTIRRLDDALARRRDYARVVEVWTSFLARHPDSARAHLERGGAYSQLQRWNEARADAARSCELWRAEGCAIAKRIGAPR